MFDDGTQTIKEDAFLDQLAELLFAIARGSVTPNNAYEPTDVRDN